MLSKIRQLIQNLQNPTTLIKNQQHPQIQQLNPHQTSPLIPLTLTPNQNQPPLQLTLTNHPHQILSHPLLDEQMQLALREK